MANHNFGLHHVGQRKRATRGKKTNKHPQPDKLKSAVDHSIYAVAMLGPVMTLPQISNVWVGRDTSGLSLVSWTAYTLVAVFWVFYGMLHRDKPIVVVNFFSILVNAVVVLGIFIFR